MKWDKQRLFLLLAVVVMSFGWSIVAYASGGERVYLGEGVTIPYICSPYKEPIDDSYYRLPVLISQGTEVDIYAATDEFYYIKTKSGHSSGYIKQKNVSFTSWVRAQSSGFEILNTMKIVNSNGLTPMLQDPNINAGIITTMSPGELVTVRMFDGDWALCTYADRYTGWIQSQYLGDAVDPNMGHTEGGLDILGTMHVVNCNEWVSLRRDNDTNSARLTTVSLGENVTVHMFADDWALCSYNQYTGWILSKYLAWN